MNTNVCLLHCAAVAAATLLAPAADAQRPVFTAVGSTFAVDEASAAKYDVNAARIRFASTATGEIVARCNVPNPMDNGLNPGWSYLEVVFRDPDARAAASRVRAVLWKVHNSNGGVSAVTDASFDSNVHGSATVNANSQMTGVPFAHVFNFASYAYYIEIRIQRSSASAAPDLSLVRLTERID